MPNLLRWLGLAPEAKGAPVPSRLALYLAGEPVWTERDYGGLARQGFQRNAVVHRAVRLVAEAAASLPLTLMDRGRAVEIPALSGLLARPNPR